MKINTTYKATGLVYGRYWGGGEGSYAAQPLQNDDLEALLEEAEQKVNDGSLDAGMGYERLLGARLSIVEIRTVEIETSPGVFETFTNDDEVIGHFVGDLTEEQQDFLDEVYFHS